MEVFSLKVDKKVVGRKFPFDRVYLVKHDDRGVIAKLFRYALVMPVEGELQNMLKECVLPAETCSHEHFRNDEAGTPTDLKESDWETILKSGPWIVVVPILTKWVKAQMPRYITAASWYYGRRGKERSAGPDVLPSLMYLQTPTKNIRPVCVACPNWIQHQNGDCKLGQRECYELLAMGLEDHFKEGMDAPPPSPNIKEEEQNDVDVHEDVA